MGLLIGLTARHNDSQRFHDKIRVTELESQKNFAPAVG